MAIADSGVTPDKIHTGLDRPLTTAETALLATWIRDAEVYTSSRFTIGEDGEWPFDLEVYAMVVRWAVEERWSKRRGGGSGEVSSKTVQADDGAITTRYGEYAQTNGRQWWFLEEWWAVLDPAAGGGDVYSVAPAFEPDHGPRVEPWLL